ncbi:hypothetical protein A1O3_10502 [Capronia epimyces CBS 606.96]|uniref:Uncharacterized protein n=1 Tax=Capronia epimyces CBS 606.96 TaxID=1182542 RepID=W9X8T4_9EURO|nr:uncharacterized protein A1O3_10502 [Capronia epimyces CBS 606.96]EXJ76857.1 hypothetical protein A1O3_10502 [Capronia epimyces CBS 606.96]
MVARLLEWLCLSSLFKGRLKLDVKVLGRFPVTTRQKFWRPDHHPFHTPLNRAFQARSPTTTSSVPASFLAKQYPKNMSSGNLWDRGAWVHRPGVGLRHYTADEVEAYIGLLILAHGHTNATEASDNLDRPVSSFQATKSRADKFPFAQSGPSQGRSTNVLDALQRHAPPPPAYRAPQQARAGIRQILVGGGSDIRGRVAALPRLVKQSAGAAQKTGQQYTTDRSTQTRTETRLPAASSTLAHIGKETGGRHGIGGEVEEDKDAEVSSMAGEE